MAQTGWKYPDQTTEHKMPSITVKGKTQEELLDNLISLGGMVAFSRQAQIQSAQEQKQKQDKPAPKPTTKD